MKCSIVRVFGTMLLSVMLLGDVLVGGVPVDQYFGEETDGVEGSDQAQRLLINQQFKRQVMRNLGNPDGTLNLDSNNIKRLMAQKRFGSIRQTRGGVALCLWKVCPAGPWLVQKK